MAIGAALLFNIILPINFFSPYKSLSIQDFWRRWHMTLGRFFTQYVYIPLGGVEKANSYLFKFIYNFSYKWNLAWRWMDVCHLGRFTRISYCNTSII